MLRSVTPCVMAAVALLVMHVQVAGAYWSNVQLNMSTFCGMRSVICRFRRQRQNGSG